MKEVKNEGDGRKRSKGRMKVIVNVKGAILCLKGPRVNVKINMHVRRIEDGNMSSEVKQLLSIFISSFPKSTEVGFGETTERDGSEGGMDFLILALKTLESCPKIWTQRNYDGKTRMSSYPQTRAPFALLHLLHLLLGNWNPPLLRTSFTCSFKDTWPFFTSFTLHLLALC